MRNNNIPTDQVNEFNRAFHKLWFKIMTSRPEAKSKKLRGLTFTDIHVISMAYEEPDIILKDIREKLRIPQTTLSSVVAKLEKKDLFKGLLIQGITDPFPLKSRLKGKK